jgi:TonB family protein
MGSTSQYIHTRTGVVDIDGLGSIADDGIVLIYLDIPPDTKVTVNGDGPNALYYSGKVHDSLKLHDGATIGQPVRSPVDVLNTARQLQTGPPPSVVYGAPGRFTANVPALRENAITLTKPRATVDGVVTARLTFTPQGTVSKVDFPTGGDPRLQRAITQAVASWRFKPWPQGEVTAVVDIQFKGGTVHGPLWD